MDRSPLVELTHSDLIARNNDNWLADNVWHPFANGTGLIQVYDTLANKPLDTYHVPAAKTFSSDWCVQAVSGAAGAIIPYVAAGKLAGMGMRAVGEEFALRGAAARFMTNESVAQIAGAGLYSFAQKPDEGQTRLGSAAGTMAGFALFSGGNLLLGKTLPLFSNPLAAGFTQAAGRFAVGAAGGLGSYEASNFVSSIQGLKHQESWDERFQSMAQGAFVNVALPAIQERANKVIDEAIHKQSWSKGMPVDREILTRDLDDPELKAIARENPLARVKRSAGDEADAQAKPESNTVVLSSKDGAAKLAHELTHLSLAKLSEPFYQQIADLAKTDPAAAERAYLALRANIESSARLVENRVQTRAANGVTAELVSDPKTVGNQIASEGKTYNELWKAEWQQFKDNPNFRPNVEYGGVRSIVASTNAYEKWLKDQIKVVPEDLAAKHAAMASDPFQFLRGTYYRWAETFPELNPELMKAPVVNSVGDLHVDNFGTWVDKQGRLVWGINDFDEAYKLPYTNDLVRLLTSAKLLIDQQHLKIGLKDAAEAVLDGYTQSLRDGGDPFILDGKHSKLAEIAKSQMPDEAHYWKHLDKQVSSVPESQVPKDAIAAIKSIMPDADASIRYGQRQAGVGSLGRQRFVGISDSKGQHFAAEVKNHLPSANNFVEGKNGGTSYYSEILGAAVRDPDPFVAVKDSWVVRSLAPNRSKIELGELSHLKEETRLLYSMGYETANVHLGTKGAAQSILKDLGSRDSSWLIDAVKTMAKSVEKDQADWKNKK